MMDCFYLKYSHQLFEVLEEVSSIIGKIGTMKKVVNISFNSTKFADRFNVSWKLCLHLWIEDMLNLASVLQLVLNLQGCDSKR